MINVGFFSEMECYENNGSVKNYIVNKIDYDKTKVIDYLKSQKKLAGCPRQAIDCLTGDVIAPSFFVYTDGEYMWCDFLLYHIEKYNISLPHSLINKAEAVNGSPVPEGYYEPYEKLLAALKSQEK